MRPRRSVMIPFRFGTTSLCCCRTAQHRAPRLGRIAVRLEVVILYGRPSFRRTAAKRGSAPAWHALRIQTARDLRDNNWRAVIFESPMKNRTIIRFAPLVAPQSLCACGARFDLSSVGSRDARMVCTISTTSSRGTNRISRVSRRSRETYPIELRREELLDQLA